MRMQEREQKQSAVAQLEAEVNTLARVERDRAGERAVLQKQAAARVVAEEQEAMRREAEEEARRPAAEEAARGWEEQELLRREADQQDAMRQVEEREAVTREAQEQAMRREAGEQAMRREVDQQEAEQMEQRRLAAQQQDMQAVGTGEVGPAQVSEEGVGEAPPLPQSWPQSARIELCALEEAAQHETLSFLQGAAAREILQCHSLITCQL